MLSTLISIILLFVVAGVVWWAAQELLKLVPLGGPFGTLVHIAMTLLLVIIVLYVLIMILNAVGLNVTLPFKL